MEFNYLQDDEGPVLDAYEKVFGCYRRRPHAFLAAGWNRTDLGLSDTDSGVLRKMF
jgi:hypothetical protein